MARFRNKNDSSCQTISNFFQLFYLSEEVKMLNLCDTSSSSEDETDNILNLLRRRRVIRPLYHSHILMFGILWAFRCHLTLFLSQMNFQDNEPANELHTESNDLTSASTLSLSLSLKFRMRMEQQQKLENRLSCGF